MLRGHYSTRHTTCTCLILAAPVQGSTSFPVITDVETCAEALAAPRSLGEETFLSNLWLNESHPKLSGTQLRWL